MKMTQRHHPYLVMGLLGVLLLQFIFALTLEETYPALIFPSFGNAPKTNAATRPVVYAYRIEARDHAGSRSQLDKEVLFGGMPPATAYRNIKRICPLAHDLARDRQSRAKHGHKTPYRFKRWLLDDLAGGYYKPDDEAVSAWLAHIKRAHHVEELSIVWSAGEEVVHACTW